jgi:hypothetical protein
MLHLQVNIDICFRFASVYYINRLRYAELKFRLVKLFTISL